MKFEENRDTYSKIATLYYMGELPQEEIADMFGISRFKVSRVLKKCRDYNIVEFHINNKPTYYAKIESQICQLLQLNNVIITPSGSTQNESKANVGFAASKFLCDNIKDGMIIGFDWGTTLQAMIREFSPIKKYPNCLFVQISGSIASQSAYSAGYMDGHDIVKTLAEKAHANWSLLPTPYIVNSSLLKEMLLEEPSIKKHFDLFAKIDMAFFGVGSGLPKYRKEFYPNYLTPEEYDKFELPPDCGEILSSAITIDGEIRQSIISNRVLTIDLDILKRLPVSVALATGNDKTNSLIAGARGKYFSVMIIDEIAALSIIQFFEQ